MKLTDDMDSGFGTKELPARGDSTANVDFANAERLPGGGTTCELYLINRRHKSVINREMATHMATLDAKLKAAETIVADPSATDSQLRDLLYELSTLQTTVSRQTRTHYHQQFTDIPPTDIDLAVVNAPAYRATLDRLTRLSQSISSTLTHPNPE